MSNNLWNETLLLKRYKLIDFVVFHPSFCNYLKKQYLFYKNDLGYNFISLPIQHNDELNVQQKHVEIFKLCIFHHPGFTDRYKKLLKFSSDWLSKHNGKVSYFKWRAKHEDKIHKKFVQYTRLFEQMTNYLFKRYLELNFSILTLDKILLCLNVEMPIRFLLIAAFFRFILDCCNKLTNFRDVKPQKLKCRRSSI